MEPNRKQGPVASDKSSIVARLPNACRDERAAVEFMEEQRWGLEPFCPHCGTVGECYQMRDRKTGERSARSLWRCRACARQFTVRVGTVLEDSRIPIMHWCLGFWLACSSKKGVSALQVKRLTGLSYKSALFMMHRIRFAMGTDHGGAPKLSGTVEVDETYIGGKPRYKGTSKPGRGTSKPPVMVLIERGGEARPVQLKGRVGATTIPNTVRIHVDLASRLVTDELQAYIRVGREFAGGHHTVKHGRGEYVRGDVHTNTAEGFFSLLKRGLYGTFHSVSRKHLHRYLCEFEFRYNTRKIDDGARTAAAIKKADGKRLTYKAQIIG